MLTINRLIFREFLGWFGLMAGIALAVAWIEGRHHEGLLPYLLGLAPLLALLSFWRIRRLGLRILRPLSHLMEGARALGAGQVPALPGTDLAELQDLGEALAEAGRIISDKAERLHKHEQSQRLETVGTLAGGIAHDVNNQLSAIIGQLHLGRDDLPEDHPLHRRLLSAEEDAQRCSQTIRTLLGFTHNLKPDRTELDLNAMIQAMVGRLERILGIRIQLDLRLESGLPPVLGERVQLEQLLANLASNARDAMPAGGSFTILTRSKGSRVHLAAIDTGTGIPPQVLPHILEPFYTTKPVGKGSGLGLAIVFGIVKAHGGHLDVRSEPGRTEIQVVLETAPPSREDGEAPSDTPCLAGKRVLVVEDEPSLRELVAEAFTRERAQAEAAPDGEKGWVLWNACRYDLIVSDQRMPECTGLELLAKVRSSGSRIPFILMSGYGLEGLEETLAQDPVLRVLPKPFTFGQLFSLSAALLQMPPPRA